MRKILLSIFFLCLFACVNDSGDNNSSSSWQGSEPAMVNFFNESSYKVDIYKNYNPAAFDSSMLLCSVDAGKNKTIEVYESSDNMTGDVFYMHYKVLLANMYEAGSNIYLDAQRDLSNMTFVVESGETYNKTIPQPELGSLKFANGYIAVQNSLSTQISVQRGISILIKLNGDEDIYIQKGGIGYYEIPINSYDQNLKLSQGQLKALGNSSVDFPEFTIERGKLYKFTVGTIVGEPEISNIGNF